MARVWAARLHGQRGFTKIVAIKTVLPHLAADPEFERMLVDEATIASGVRHPNVCEIYELGEDRETVYIAMEWVHGDSLAQILKGGKVEAKGEGSGSVVLRRPIDPRIAARILADAAAGLHAAHNLTSDEGKPLEVVHRDVSPHNLLVSMDGNVKVTDFGVAKAIGASHEATRAGQIKGKLAYMSPEQAAGGAVDRRSDVFSLGCVLYEATTGKKPFRSEGDNQVLRELVKTSFPPPTRMVQGYPFELERIVLRALAAQPLHRFPTMDHMRIALEEWLAKSGPVVTQSHVAAMVRERVGTQVDQRRERIRAATAAINEEGGTGRRSHPPADPSQLTPSGTPPERRITPSGVIASGNIPPPGRPSYPSFAETSSRHSLPPSFPPTPAPQLPSRTSAVQYVTAASLGVLATAALCALGFWVWSSTHGAPAAAAAHVNAATVVPVRPLAPNATPSIAFDVTPPDAVLVIDGVPLDPSVRTIPRPPVGTEETVVVRAEGYADRTLRINDTAGVRVGVRLVRKAASDPAGAGLEIESPPKAP
jgi:serine/threonine-protein kinase